MGVPLPGLGGNPPTVFGHVYFVKKTTDTDYTEFYNNHFNDYDDGTTSVQNTIQAAVNCTVSGRNDVVIVCPGKWTEEVVIVGRAGLRIMGAGYGTGMQEPGGTRMRPSDATTHYPFTTKIGTVCSGACFHVLSRNVEITGFYMDFSGGYAGVYLGGGLNGGITGYTTETTSGSWIHRNYIRGGGDGYVGIYMNGSKFGVIIEDNVFERNSIDAIQMDAGNASCERPIIRFNTFQASTSGYGIRTYGEAGSCYDGVIAGNYFCDGVGRAFTDGIYNQAGSTGVMNVLGNHFSCAKPIKLLTSDIVSGNSYGFAGSATEASNLFVVENAAGAH